MKGPFWWLSGIPSACNAGAAGHTGLIPAYEDLCKRVWQPTPVFWPGESQEQEEPGELLSKALKSQTRLM